jgi:pyridoxal phosphate enzyme (YggS family)
MNILANLARLYEEIPSTVKIVAVTKTMPVGTILEAYRAGHRIFGENKAQELSAKQPYLPGDIKWHFIGHLQTNKVKYIAPFVEMIESVDSLKILQEINKQAEKNNRVIKCLLQFHIATEETKFGLDLEEAEAILSSSEYSTLKNISLNGVMGMASLSDDTALITEEFRKLKLAFSHLRNEFFRDNPEFCEISMGMTGDYNIAIKEGSTIVRIGTGIFGKMNV